MGWCRRLARAARVCPGMHAGDDKYYVFDCFFFPREREREGERERIHYVQSACLAYKERIVFMSGPFAARQ